MRLYSQLKFSRTTLIILCLVSFLAGLGLARLRLLVIGVEAWLSVVVYWLVASRKNILSVISICLLGVTIGLWRGQVYLLKLDNYNSLYSQKVVLVGRADSDGSYGKGSQLSFDLNGLKVVAPYHGFLVGKVSVKGYGENAVYRGDLVVVTGKLYRSRGSRQGSLSYAKISVVKRSTSTINSLRRRFETGMLSALPEPMASFGLGLLIGDRSTLPPMVNDELSIAGLTHIVAVSGYNLTIIASAVYFLLKKFSKYQATLLSVVLVLLFVLLAGTSASIISAAIVSLLSLWAGYYGRTIKPLLLVLLAAAITAGWSPTYLWSDIGWYLSFLAFFGILVVAPLVIYRMSRRKPRGVLALVIVETMAAQLMTVPIIMYIFGKVSLIALPANILVVPLVPLAMLLSFVAALAGMLIPALAGWLAVPARIVLTYMLDIVSLVARVPHALSLQSLGLVQAISAYGLILIVCVLLWLINHRKDGIITDIKVED